MGVPAIITLSLVVLSTVLLIGGWLAPDLIALLVMVVLGLSAVVTPQQALAGFSSSAVITILAISLIAEGLRQTGVTDWLARQMQRFAGRDERRLLAVVLLSGAFLSPFMNNIAALGVLLPATLSLSQRTREPPGRLLMPLAFGVIAGGMATLFTTSNLIASSALRDAGLRPFGMLDFVPVGLPVVLVTLLYMLFIGRHGLSTRQPAEPFLPDVAPAGELTELYQLERSLWRVTLLPDSPLAGTSIRDGQWRLRTRLNIVGLEREGRFTAAPSAGTILRAGDTVLAQGVPDSQVLEGLGLRPEVEQPQAEGMMEGTTLLAELVIAPHSELRGKSLRDVDFRKQSNLTVLALWRSGEPLHTGFASLPLRAGDALLVYGPSADVQRVTHDPRFVVAAHQGQAAARPGKAPLAGGIFLAALALAIFSPLPVPLLMLAAAALMAASGCLSLAEAYRAVDWRAIVLIAGLWPLSTAMQTSGLAAAIVRGVLGATSGAGPLLITALVLLVTAVLTNLMAGQAAAPIIMAPIGLQIAQASGLDPRMMLMAIALGCSLAFLTPIGHPVNIVVMGPGGYTFRDFLRVGGPLTLLIFPLVLLGLHLFWGL